MIKTDTEEDVSGISRRTDLDKECSSDESIDLPPLSSRVEAPIEVTKF